MPRVVLNILCVLPGLMCATVHAQENKPARPGVLIIGDDVYQQLAMGAVSELKHRARVHIAKWPARVLPSSTNALEQIDLLLGLKDAAGNDVPEAKRPTWDLIHLNVGLGDLIHRVPNLKSHRSLPYDLGGVITTDAAQYEKQLETLIQLIRIKVPTAKIIWASTTPIRSSNAKFFKLGSEVEYNQIAARVMKKHGVRINDMHAYVLGVIDMSRPNGQDPFHFDGKAIHPPIVETIADELDLPIKTPAEELLMP